MASDDKLHEMSSEMVARRVIGIGCFFPQIVCLCGSTRFWKTFQEEGLRLTLAGLIVLSVGSATASDEDHGISAGQKVLLDELHKRKIDLADFVFVLNVGGYVGESTRSEVLYARKVGKRVVWFESNIPEDLRDE